MYKIKVAVVILLPVLTGISACYVCIMKCLPLRGKEGGISFGFHLMVYYGFLISVVLPIVISAMMYIWQFIHSFRLGIKAIVLILLFFVLLLVAPFLMLYVLWRL